MFAREIVVVLSVLSAALCCVEYKDCESCAGSEHRVRFSMKSCEWCPLTLKCRTQGSVFANHCDRDLSVGAADLCGWIEEPRMKYDSQLAEELAKWSSLAYVDPRKLNKSSIQSAVDAQFNNSYQLVEFLMADCDWAGDENYCKAVVAKSESQNRIVVALEGTFSSYQSHGKDNRTYFTNMTTFSPTGGKVLLYRKAAHDSLYPCVKSLLKELTTTMPTAEVMVTGHAFGGAQAQLMAAHMITNDVASRRNVHIYTFGSPRVGDKGFAYSYDRMADNSWRVTRRNDFMALGGARDVFPFCFHTRREVYYDYPGVMNSTTDYKICDSNEGEEGCLEDRADMERGVIAGNLYRYFVPNISEYMKNFMKAGNNTITKRRATCHTMPF